MGALDFDQNHLWHPYTTVGANATPVLEVKQANGVRLTLADDRTLIDGMSSWWAAIHGYNHPILNKAIEEQLTSMAHVMFGGLSHQPAINLGKALLAILPPSLNKIFYSDSGSVAVEIAIKMAMQYWRGQKQQRHKLLALEGGYHGDTFATMALCDPDNGLHQRFSSVLTQHFFAPTPSAQFGDDLPAQDLEAIESIFKRNHSEIAAVILEPILQGAGGMRNYSAAYLKTIRHLCDQYSLPLIADEIATGFGRTGTLFAIEHADIVPDIICLGKALSGGYLSFAATICNDKIAEGIKADADGVLQHGPTYMANPLACAVSIASIRLLLNSNWQKRIKAIEGILHKDLKSLASHPQVASVRVLGATGAITFKHSVNCQLLQNSAVEHGVWLRPFGKVLYTMPAYIINNDDLGTITTAMRAAVTALEC